ncbi:MAG: 50S ribosomal protein L6 [Candidatus Muproteobacteria bacterium RBG_16_60_9]|uniref:Large ribosomal subunit protein uL6 n=1 Tax=Candidatus Muproteobacteria bacterium RBG_16_60_9 TaxID=1817755 RepID=A0A1F6UY53_9PROT|nr:MAG: 50S ribosomal protein L6 [Candidatus Muproteobacteria bacterium RBG_16_60_9]
MSRVAKYPVVVPKGVEVKLAGRNLSVKGPKGQLTYDMHPLVNVTHAEGELRFQRINDTSMARAISGTMRALANNMVNGVAKGFEKKLTIIGVGFRAAVQGKKLNLTLGYSHPIAYAIPDGVTIEAPSQTDLIVRGANRQMVGQVAAEIRAYRPPEPYKGKGVRYVDEVVVRKEAKKK